jgi:hypothetical protein
MVIDTSLRIAQAVIDRLRIDQSIHEHLAVADRQVEALMFLDGRANCFLHAGQHKIRHRPALKGGGV